VGTADPIHDALEQQRLNLSKVYRPDGTLVCGELMTFDDPDVRLLALDCLEGFETARPSLYRRVLIPTETLGALAFWPEPTLSRSPREPTCPTDAGHPEPGTKTLVCETS
jgi:hypothetical protein